MKLRIVTDAKGVHLELTYDTGQKPVRHVLTRTEVESLIKILRVAADAKAFTFELELP